MSSSFKHIIISQESTDAPLKIESDIKSNGAEISSEIKEPDQMLLPSQTENIENVKQLAIALKKFQQRFKFLVDIEATRNKIKSQRLSELENKSWEKVEEECKFIINEGERLKFVVQDWLRTRITTEDIDLESNHDRNYYDQEILIEIPENYNFDEIVGSMKDESRENI